MFKQLLEKWSCKHKWKVHYESNQSYESRKDGKRYVSHLYQTLICEKCGKITKIEV